MKQGQTDIKHGDGVSQVGLDMVFSSIKDFLGITDDSQQRKGSFHNHAVIPRAFLAQFDVGRHTRSTAKAPISQDNRLAVVFLKESQEILVRTVHLIPNPAADLPTAVKNPTQLDAHTPAAFVLTLSAKLRFGTTFSNRKDQLDRITIHHIQ